MHSIRTSWCNQHTDIPAIDVNGIMSEVFLEIMHNSDDYILFLEPPTRHHLISGIKKYFMEWNYNQQFGDLAPLIIVNAMGVNIKILDEDRHWYCNDKLTILCRSTVAPLIIVHRRNNHYNEIITTHNVYRQHTDQDRGKGHRYIYSRESLNESLLESARATYYPRLRLSSDELKSMNSDNLMVHRRTRKSLIKLGIWNPKQWERLIPVIISDRHEHGQICRNQSMTNNRAVWIIRSSMGSQQLADLHHSTMKDNVVISALLPAKGH